jgi:phenylpropionate dioxygenase-like ring-hydroxylating dioxygenase large terminal subunit
VRIPDSALVPGAVVPVAVGGEEFVVWRGADGRVRSAPRTCPHLDHDLAEGYVSGCELVCAGHGWAFDGDGAVYKRNEFGRADPKGTVATLHVRTGDGAVALTLGESGE